MLRYLLVFLALSSPAFAQQFAYQAPETPAPEPPVPLANKYCEGLTAKQCLRMEITGCMYETEPGAACRIFSTLDPEGDWNWNGPITACRRDTGECYQLDEVEKHRLRGIMALAHRRHTFDQQEATDNMRGEGIRT